MNKKILVVLLMVCALGAGLLLYYFMERGAAVSNSEPQSTSTALAYKNTELGFSFSLPDSWKGYTIVETTWQGTPATSSVASTSGPKIVIRHPKWTAATPYEDLPILVFTLAEWDSYVAEDFTVSAAPIQATELARNNTYVFALPPRWDFDYSQGYQEAQAIMAGKALRPFPVGVIIKKSQAKLNTDLVCEKSVETMRFADKESLDAFVADCKAGKHPEVIEKYKIDLNLGAGVAI